MNHLRLTIFLTLILLQRKEALLACYIKKLEVGQWIDISDVLQHLGITEYSRQSRRQLFKHLIAG